MRSLPSLSGRLLLLVFLFIAGSAAGEEAFLEASRWRFFDNPDEVSSLYINDFAQEIGGNVWLATERLLIRYDGSVFTRVKVPGVPDSTRYHCLLYSADGTIWVGTSAGLLRYVAHEWDYPIRSGNVTALTESADGAIWAGVSPASFDEYAEGREPEDYVAANAGVFRYAHGTWKHYGPGDGIPALPVRMLYGDRTGGVWGIFGSPMATGTLFRFRRGRWTGMATVIHPPTGNILTMAQTRDGAYWFGTYRRGVWRFKNGVWERFQNTRGLRSFTAASLLPMPDGSLWAVGAPAGTIYNYSEGAWQSYPVRQVGIAGRMISKMVYSLDDAFWFLIPGRGIARFSRRGGPWWIFDQKRGLPPTGSISHIVQGAGRTVWLGTTVGLVRYDGSRFVIPPVVRHVSDQQITGLLAWPDGRIWIASGSPVSRPGIWQYDGTAWLPLSTTPVLDRQAIITALMRAENGDVWVGTAGREDTGGYGVFQLHADQVFRGRGEGWRQYTTKDGLLDDHVLSIAEDRSGTIWVGTARGVSAYDGRTWKTVGEMYASTLAGTSDGAMWVGGNRPNAGLSRYRNGRWTHFTVESGLASDDVWSIVEAEDKSLWVGTARGVSRYDGAQWFTFRAENGLAKDQVWASALLGDGSLWFGHFDGAITRYRAASSDAPRTFLEPLPRRLAYPGFLTVQWSGRDKWERTRQRDLLYSWRLDGGAWGPFTDSTSHMFTTLPHGKHVFHVVAMDQEGNVDIAGAVGRIVVDPPFWLAAWFVVPTCTGLLGIGIFAAIAYQRNRRWKHAQSQLVGELQRELQVAQRLQNDLLPQHDPTVPGLEISGLCRPASRVGGDYYTYFWLDDGASRLGLAVADVTGHAMQAAIPAVLFSGMLATASQQMAGPAEMLTVLNESLYTRTETHTFICCTIAVFDLSQNMLYLANAGGLDPIRRRNGTVEPIEVEGDRLPLGLISDVLYAQHEIPLLPGDTYVFLTDGLVEAKSPTGELFGFERVAQSVARADGVAEIHEELLKKAVGHMATREQDDDITLLVVRVANRQ